MMHLSTYQIYVWCILYIDRDWWILVSGCSGFEIWPPCFRPVLPPGICHASTPEQQAAAAQQAAAKIAAAEAKKAAAKKAVADKAAAAKQAAEQAKINALPQSKYIPAPGGASHGTFSMAALPDLPVMTL